MKTLRKLVALVALTCVLSLSAYAGDISSPPVSSTDNSIGNIIVSIIGVLLGD
ncbi:MAG TPA: hypothetical protein VF553_02235 [Pyrinomonadaceae bacterium]|jgi:hypothetical protein